MRALTSAKKTVDFLMEWLCIIILAAMTILVTYQVITRYFFNKPSAMSENTAQYLFVWMVMFGSAYVFGSREHLNIDYLKDKFSPIVNLVVEILINITLFMFSALVCAWGGWIGAMKQMPTMDAATKISMGLIYMSIPVCGAAMLFYAVYNIFLAVREYKANVVSSNCGSNSTM